MYKYLPVDKVKIKVKVLINILKLVKHLLNNFKKKAKWLKQIKVRIFSKRFKENWPTQNNHYYTGFARNKMICVQAIFFLTFLHIKVVIH